MQSNGIDEQAQWLKWPTSSANYYVFKQNYMGKNEFI